MDNYQTFVIVAGALAKLVVVAMLLERGLAVIFEYEWFVRLTTKKDGTSRFPGLKGILAPIAAYIICNEYDFDVLFVVLNGTYPKTVDPLGVALTSLIVAGGSAGAIMIFQGYLNLSKQGRDAAVEAKKTAAEADKVNAEADKAEAEARKRAVV